jgi:hypothetical protein
MIGERGCLLGCVYLFGFLIVISWPLGLSLGVWEWVIEPAWLIALLILREWYRHAGRAGDRQNPAGRIKP